MKTLIVFWGVVVFPILLCGAVQPSQEGADAPDEIIARAREFLGGDEALDAVRTLRFVGTITLPDGRVGPVEIVVRKPEQFRQVMEIEATPPAARTAEAKQPGDAGEPADAASSTGTAESGETKPPLKIRQTTALDGYDGWSKLENADNSAQWELHFLDARKIERLRANTWENISFFRGLERHGGRVALAGEAQIGGVDCVKVAFIHSPRVTFTRYFNKETGQLVLTETEVGDTRESGEIHAGGVRFPRKIITTSEDGTTIVDFEQVEVNAEFGDEIFRVPPIRPGVRAGRIPR